MPENQRDAEHVALGLIVAAILFLLFRRKIEWFFRSRGLSGGGCGCNGAGGRGGSTGVAAGAPPASPGACGGKCSNGCSTSSGVDLATNPGITLGVGLGRSSGWTFSGASSGSDAYAQAQQAGLSGNTSALDDYLAST